MLDHKSFSAAKWSTLTRKWTTPLNNNYNKIKAIPVTAMDNNSIQFNSLFLCAESTATRPITDTAQHRNIIIKIKIIIIIIIIIIIKHNNSRQYVK
jgi:hypothetical protein